MPKHQDEKISAEAPPSTETIEHLPSNSDKDPNTLKQHLEAFLKEAQIAGDIANSIDTETCFDRAWGTNLEHSPAWAIDHNSYGMVSDFIETAAEIYPAAHQKNSGTLRTYICHRTNQRFPMVHVDVFQDGRNHQERNRTGAQINRLRLFPWEIDHLIAALEAARDLSQSHISTTENALRNSGAFVPLEDA